MAEGWSTNDAAALCAIAREAGACILKHRTAGYGSSKKPDGTSVTDADKEAEQLILQRLEQILPGIPIISEEKENRDLSVDQKTFWLVDPLDGTRDFMAGSPEFSVNIGLIIDAVPVVGVVYAPLLDDLFYGDPSGAIRINADGMVNLRPTRMTPTNRPRVTTGRREADILPFKNWLETGWIDGWRICSSAIKFGLIAGGEQDILVRCVGTKEWDTAAGDAVLRSMGGKTIAMDGQPMRYGKAGFKNDFHIAYVADHIDPVFLESVMAKMRQALSLPETTAD